MNLHLEIEKMLELFVGGKETWTGRGILRIWSSGQYKVDVLLRKCFTVSYLTKKQKRTKARFCSIIVENNRPAVREGAMETDVAKSKKRKQGQNGRN